MSKQDCQVFLKSAQSQAWKNVFETLKELLQDVVMIFTPEGIRICQMDRYEVVMVDLFIDAEKMIDYYCPKTFDVGISVHNLYRVLKNINSKSQIIMYILKDDVRFLEIIIDSENSVQQFEYSLKLLDLENEGIMDIDQEQYKIVLNMTSNQFRQICQNNKVMNSKNIRIIFNKGEYTFSGDGAFGSQTCRHKAKRINCDDDESEDDYHNEIFHGLYSMEKFSNFSKCTGSADKVTFLFKNDSPLICFYELPIGDIHLILSPLSEEN